MSHDVSQIDPALRRGVADNPQYQKIQQELKAKAQQAQDIKKETDEQTKVQKPEDTSNRQSAVAKLLAESADNVSVSPRFNWKKKDGEWDVKLTPEQRFLTNVKTDGKQVLNILGFKIDFSSKTSELKQSFMQNMIQARSDNFLLSKYGQFKVGALGTLLTLLGVSADELKALQEEAIAGAIEDNKTLMEQSLYDEEVMNIVGQKKSKKAAAVMKEIQDKLVSQMDLLGEPGYWSPSKITEVRLAQVGRIAEEFEKEAENSRYLKDYMTEVGG